MEIKVSAGLLMYRFNNGILEVLLGHPGGPYYMDKDNGYWGIPKGGVEANETLLETAIREFTEETGIFPVLKNCIYLGSVLENNGKIICIWAFRGSCDTSLPVNSNLFQMEWPELSGKLELFPEIDKIQFFSSHTAKYKIEAAQASLLRKLERYLQYEIMNTIFAGKKNLRQVT